jgi:hypothetical protein
MNESDTLALFSSLIDGLCVPLSLSLSLCFYRPKSDIQTDAMQWSSFGTIHNDINEREREREKEAAQFDDRNSVFGNPN